MYNIDQIQNKQSELANNILKGFNNVEAPIKAISREGFDKEFGAGHDVFTVNQLVKFNEDLKKAASNDLDNESEILEKGHAELGSLERISVLESDKKITTVFVRKSK